MEGCYAFGANEGKSYTLLFQLFFRVNGGTETPHGLWQRSEVYLLYDQSLVYVCLGSDESHVFTHCLVHLYWI